jgi:uncharacterized protein (DUF433 family)/DNA-binding transcriptional MerR regulator
MNTRGTIGGGIYASRLAAKLAGVSLRRLRYWVAKGLMEPSLRRGGAGGRDLYSYTDLVHARTIGRLRAQGASLQRIGRAVMYLRQVLPSDEQWHTKTLATDGIRVFVLYGPDEVLEASHRSPGQRVFHVSLAEVAEELKRAGLQIGLGETIQVDPGVQGGAPVIRDTRIPTKLIGELLEEGVAPERIARMYPGVTADAIDAAMEFERQLAAV